MAYNSKNLTPSRGMGKRKLTRMTSYKTPMGSDSRQLPTSFTNNHVFTDNEKKFLTEQWQKQYSDEEEELEFEKDTENQNKKGTS